MMGKDKTLRRKGISCLRRGTLRVPDIGRDASRPYKYFMLLGCGYAAMCSLWLEKALSEIMIVD
jgi:hypothetical protein